MSKDSQRDGAQNSSEVSLREHRMTLLTTTRAAQRLYGLLIDAMSFRRWPAAICIDHHQESQEKWISCEALNARPRSTVTHQLLHERRIPLRKRHCHRRDLDSAGRYARS